MNAVNKVNGISVTSLGSNLVLNKVHFYDMAGEAVSMGAISMWQEDPVNPDAAIIYSVSGFEIANCKFNTSASIGLELIRASAGTIHNNEFDYIHGTALQPFTGCKNLDITNNSFYYCGAGIGADGSFMPVLWRYRNPVTSGTGPWTVQDQYNHSLSPLGYFSDLVISSNTFTSCDTGIVLNRGVHDGKVTLSKKQSDFSCKLSSI